MPIVKPFRNSLKFSSIAENGIATGPGYTILATSFTTDTGIAAIAFPSSLAYYNLYINGQIQTVDTSTITTAAINIPDGDTLSPSTPIVVEFVVN